MNVRQLELFYYVALHKGVSQASRALGKEQPTLSKQINDLEDYLRTRLYHRRPFKLTDRGEILFRAIEPFFRGLQRLEQQVKGGDSLRVGASPIVLLHHLPAVEKEVRREFPNLHLVLREANQPQLVQWLESREIDLAITLLPRDLPQKVFAKPLLELALVLLVPKEHPLTGAGELWRQPEVQASLICLTPDEIVCREFQEKLRRMGVDWRPRVEVGSLNLIEHYVLEGDGIGLSVRVPGMPVPPRLRMLPLPGFPTLKLAMLWRDDQDRLLRAFREQAEAQARRVSKDPPEILPAERAAPGTPLLTRS